MYRIMSLVAGIALFASSAQADEPRAKEGREGEKQVQRDGEKKVEGQRDGERKVEGKRDGERPAAGREDGSLRAIIKSVDLDKGVITVVISGDGGTTVRTFSLAGKEVKVTGVADKLSALREGLQVYLQLSQDEDVLAIRSETAKRNSKAGRIFAAYDKSGDDKVLFEEWLQMKEGAMTAARKAAERSYFDFADKNRDGSVSFPEFEFWLENRGRAPEAGARPNVELPNPIRKDQK